MQSNYSSLLSYRLRDPGSDLDPETIKQYMHDFLTQERESRIDSVREVEIAEAGGARVIALPFKARVLPVDRTAS